MSTDTLTERESVRERVLALAMESLQSLEALEDDYCDWLDALNAQHQLDCCWDPTDSEQEGDWLEERETVRLYLERRAEDGLQSEYVSEDGDPVLEFLESVLDIVTVSESRSGETPEPRGWEILLCTGGPAAGLELGRDGHATVWAAWWSPEERVYGRLDWLAGYLEELGL